MTVSPDLDTRFRTAASRSGLLDVAYDVVDSPIGNLLIAATERGVCRISFDPVPEAEAERLARGFGARVLRVPRALDEVKRELDEYFDGRRRSFDLSLDLRPVAEFHRDVLGELARVPYGELTTYGTLAGRVGRPRAARAVGTETRSRSCCRATASSAPAGRSPGTAAASTARSTCCGWKVRSASQVRLRLLGRR